MKFYFFQNLAYFYQYSKDIRPLVLLHGFMGSSQELLSLFSPHFPHLLAIDLPGHGKSSIDSSVDSIEKLIYQIKDLLTHLSIHQVDLYGYSMGGRMALSLADTFPHLIKRLILESVSLGFVHEKEKKSRLHQDQKLLSQVIKSPHQKQAFRKFLVNWYSQEIFKDFPTHPQFQQFIDNKIELQNVVNLQKAIDAFSVGRQKHFQEKIGQFLFPILYLYGEHDKKYKKLGEFLRGAPTVQVQEIANAAHNGHFQNPQSVQQHVSNFLLNHQY